MDRDPREWHRQGRRADLLALILGVTIDGRPGRLRPAQSRRPFQKFAGGLTSHDIFDALRIGTERVALDYAGWEPGQLEEEVLANSWLTEPTTPGIIFDPTASAGRVRPGRSASISARFRKMSEQVCLRPFSRSPSPSQRSQEVQAAPDLAAADRKKDCLKQ